mmetsp:Transcript_40316/g.67224  ORF Transcript_40316/g.67224 Transcript_40316/m.67224 type:complete len:83 (-) Transcript_40316:2058-2306(-)
MAHSQQAATITKSAGEPIQRNPHAGNYKGFSSSHGKHKHATSHQKTRGHAELGRPNEPGLAGRGHRAQDVGALMAIFEVTLT